MNDQLETNYIDYIPDISTLICRFASLFKLDSLLDLQDPFLKTMTRFFELSKENGFSSVLEFINTSLNTKSPRIFAGSMIAFGFVAKPIFQQKYVIHNLSDIICKIIFGISSKENPLFIRDSCLWTLRQFILYSKDLKDFIDIIQEKLESCLIENNVLLSSTCLSMIELIKNYKIESSFINRLSDIMIQMFKKIERTSLKHFLQLFDLLIQNNEIIQFKLKDLDLMKFIKYDEIHSEILKLYSYLPNSSMEDIISTIFSQKLNSSSALLCICKYLKNGKKLEDSQKKIVRDFIVKMLYKKEDLETIYHSILSLSNQNLQFVEVNDELISSLESDLSNKFLLKGLDVYKQLSFKLKDQNMIEKLFNFYIDIFDKSQENEQFILQSYSTIPIETFIEYKSLLLNHIGNGLKNHPYQSMLVYEKFMKSLSYDEQFKFISKYLSSLSEIILSSNKIQEKICYILYKSIPTFKESEKKEIHFKLYNSLVQIMKYGQKDASQYSSLCLCHLLVYEKEIDIKDEDFNSLLKVLSDVSDPIVNEFLKSVSKTKKLSLNFSNQISDCLSRKIKLSQDEIKDKEMNPSKVVSRKKEFGLQERIIQ